MRKAQSSARKHLGAFLDEIIKGQQQYSMNQISTLTQTDRASIYQMFSGDRMCSASRSRKPSGIARGSNPVRIGRTQFFRGNSCFMKK